MSFVGIAVRVTGGAPYLRGVVLDDPNAGDQDRFEFRPTATEDLPTQILGIADGLAGRLEVLTTPLTRVVLRLGDERQGHAKGPIQARTRTEGAVLYVARRFCVDVRALHGPDIGRACGTDRDGAEAQARTLMGAADWVVAGSAALAAQSL